MADLALQGLDPLGEGGAGDLQKICCGVEGPLIDREHEGPQVIGVHASESNRIV